MVTFSIHQVKYVYTRSSPERNIQVKFKAIILLGLVSLSDDRSATQHDACEQDLQLAV